MLSLNVTQTKAGNEATQEFMSGWEHRLPTVLIVDFRVLFG